MAYNQTELELRRLPDLPKPRRRMPTVAEAVLLASAAIGLIAYLAFYSLTGTADRLERQMDHVQAARGTVEAR